MPFCHAGHALKHHLGRRDGLLQCDGPDNIMCCDGNGVLNPGDRRWSCAQCDYDICDFCAGESAPAADGAASKPIAGISQAVKDANFEEKYNQQCLAQAMLGADGQSRSRLGKNSREAYVPKKREQSAAAQKEAPARTADELAAATALAEAAAAALLAEEGVTADGGQQGKASKKKAKAQPAKLKSKPEAPPLSAAEAAEAATARKRADIALNVALASAAIHPEGLRAALEEHSGYASAEVLAEARKVRDKLKERAKKAAKKAEKLLAASPQSPAALATGKAEGLALTGEGGKRTASRLEAGVEGAAHALLEGCD